VTSENQLNLTLAIIITVYNCIDIIFHQMFGQHFLLYKDTHHLNGTAGIIPMVCHASRPVPTHFLGNVVTGVFRGGEGALVKCPALATVLLSDITCRTSTI